MKHNKKGNIVSLIFLVVVLLGLAMTSIIGLKILHEYNGHVQTNDIFSNDTKSMTSTEETRLPATFDAIFFFVFIMFSMGLLISAWFIDTHPVFFIFTLFLLVIVVILAAIFSNSFEKFSQEPMLSNQSVQFPITTYVMTNLPILCFIIGIALIIVLFAKYKMGGGI